LYPRRIERLIRWYDALSDWQRIQYAGAIMLALLARGGYLLGVSSSVLV